jgi:hypothetical protein
MQSSPPTEEVLLSGGDSAVSPRARSKSAVSLFGGLDKLSLFALIALIVYAAVRSICQAAVKPLWLDEIFTAIIVRQHGISGMWDALRHSADGQPLLFYLLEWPATVVFRNEQIAYRLLSIIGFSITTACLFALVRKRNGSGVALVCASIPMLSILYSGYSVEARPYAIVIACISMALVCYQRAPEIRWMLLMGLCLALAGSLHFYAVLAFAPFGMAEAVFTVTTRRLRWAVWLALACGFIPISVFWPFLSRLKSEYGAHFWSPNTYLQVHASTAWFFNISVTNGINLLGISVLAILISMFVHQRAVSRGARPAGASLHEHILVLGFLALPFICFFAAEIAHTGMTLRYMLPTVLGFPLALGYTFPKSGRVRSILLGSVAICLVFALAFQENRFWSSYTGHFVSPAKTIEDLVTAARRPELPVVVSEPNDYLEAAHYSSPDWATRFVSVIDVPQAIAYAGTDAIDKQFEVLRRYAPLKIYDFPAFAAEHPVFLLYSGGAASRFDWWPDRLVHDGYTLRVVAVKDMSHRVFLATRGDNPNQKGKYEPLRAE